MPEVIIVHVISNWILRVGVKDEDRYTELLDQLSTAQVY